MKPKVKIFKYLKEKIRKQSEIINYCKNKRNFYIQLLNELLEEKE